MVKSLNIFMIYLVRLILIKSQNFDWNVQCHMSFKFWILVYAIKHEISFLLWFFLEVIPFLSLPSLLLARTHTLTISIEHLYLKLAKGLMIILLSYNGRFSVSRFPSSSSISAWKIVDKWPPIFKLLFN
ncbi:hypothetical protein KFK09_008103 [Dendrobium nobile]|uniref:Uncharacterized protein n=1 Tax=Dendrobium nobile TaxID=94219 RepID=A0A8T3BTN3_DENNO|nr:hypothetical protein KFK09_008103 [Dendrobium nobile]